MPNFPKSAPGSTVSSPICPSAGGCRAGVGGRVSAGGCCLFAVVWCAKSRYSDLGDLSNGCGGSLQGAGGGCVR